MSATRTGSCHCGAVRVTLPAEAFGVIACHCDDCQKLHGNYFAMLAVADTDVQIDGVDHVRWYASSHTARRSHCEVCGSRLFKQPIGTGRLLVSVGMFGRDTGLRLRKQVFEASKPDWYDLPGVA